MNANTVIGQSSFTTSGNGITQNGLNSPRSILYDTGTAHLFVADRSSSRVLVFSGALLSNGMNANTVLGEANFTSSVLATTPAGMTNPNALAYDGIHKHLFVIDTGNHRVLVFSGASLSNGMNANTVLGQADFTHKIIATTQAGMQIPRGGAYDTTTNRLYIGDNGNNRILVFSGASLSNGMNASDALGQYDDSLTNPQPVYTKALANNGPNKLGLNPAGLVQGTVLDSTNHRLFVTDAGNNRVLVYNLNGDNTFPDRIPDIVLGQPNFYSNGAATT